jgi:hypothetical protein
MGRANHIAVLLGIAVVTALGCKSSDPRAAPPPAPDVAVTEEVQPPVRVTARENVPALQG